MPRELLLGNDRMLVSFDADYRLRDFFYPHIGTGEPPGRLLSRMGSTWTGSSAGSSAAGWSIAIRVTSRTAWWAGSRRATRSWGLRSSASTPSDFHEALYVREIVLHNLRPTPRRYAFSFTTTSPFLGDRRGGHRDFDPVTAGRGALQGCPLLPGQRDGRRRRRRHRWATGQKGVNGREGTFRDAEDGVLTGNPIAQGAVDSGARGHLPGAGRRRKARSRTGWRRASAGQGCRGTACASSTPRWSRAARRRSCNARATTGACG